MSYCNTCQKWNGPAAVPAGANTDHLCRCPPRAQLRILQAVPLTEERVREIVRDELAKAKAGDGVRACGSNECVAGQRDGVLCANGECDRENGVRPDGVATRHPRCGYPYCACVGECFVASQPGVTAGVLADGKENQHG